MELTDHQKELLQTAYDCMVETMEKLAAALQIVADAFAEFDWGQLKEAIYTRKKLPRPPKRLGPVNKANYAASRPRRVARSNCARRRY